MLLVPVLADSGPCAGFGLYLKMGKLRYREVRALPKALTAFLTLGRLNHMTVFTCVNSVFPLWGRRLHRGSLLLGEMGGARRV